MGRWCRWELLASPAFLVATALLLANDHLLKQVWPGWVTGKLSDVAGVAMFAVGLTAIGGRRALAFATTAAAFAGLKMVPAAAVWAAPVLGGVTRTDPTDAMVATLALVPLWFVVGPGPDEPRPRGSTSALGVRVVAVGAAVFATTATSCGVAGVWNVSAVDGTLYAFWDNEVWTSDDGTTWVDSGISALDGDFEVPPDARQSCAASVCFEARKDGSGTEIVTWPEADTSDVSVLLTVARADLTAHEDIQLGGCGVETASTLAAIELADGVHVFVSMSELGVLHWHDSAWSWSAVGRWGVPSSALDDPPLGIPVASVADTSQSFLSARWLAVALAILSVGAALSGVVMVARLAGRRGRNPIGYTVFAAFGACATVLTLGLVLAFSGGPTNGPLRLVAIGVAFGVAASVIGVAAALASRRLRHGELRPPHSHDQVR